MHAAARPRSPSALLIDGMGTLVRLQDPAPLLAAALRERVGVTVGVDQAQRALAAEIRHYRAHMQEGRDAESVAALRGRCAAVMQAALAAEQPALASAPAADMTAALLDALRFTAHADARDALVRVRGAGARVIVVSNWDVSLAEVLERVGLAPLVDAVVTSAAVGAGKPAPAIFAHALALAGVRDPAAATVVHVGDSLAEDVAGARACGIAAILLARDGDPSPVPPPDVAVLGSLDELQWPPVA